MADAKTLEDKLSRDELNELATSKGVENPEGFANKGVLAEKLEAEGVTDEELDKFVADHADDTETPDSPDDTPEDDTTPSPGTNTSDPASADDLNTLHEPGSVRDGSAANEDLTPKDEEHPDINADPGGRQATAGNGDSLDDSSNNSKTPRQTAKDGQATAERNGAEEAELHRAALDSGTTRESSTLDDQAAEGWKTARRNVTASRKAEKLNADTAATSTPVDSSSK
jgi:hypothetical protein